MITKAIAQTLTPGQELHYTGRHQCTKTVGPRGGIKVSITTVRVTGQLRTWVTRPEDFIIPVKYGLYESSYIDHNNGADFHLPEDCPLNKHATDCMCPICLPGRVIRPIDAR